jgi:CheY-like chemotaxis protein
MGLNLLLADDDHDDCIFFKAALGGIDQQLNLTVVNDGVELMEFLSSQTGPLPDVLFLDLNMPRKNGFECMNEIKSNEKLKTLPVIILTTCFDLEVVDLLYKKGVHYYIRKPGEFATLKKVLHEALFLISQHPPKRPEREEFILQSFL